MKLVYVSVQGDARDLKEASALMGNVWMTAKTLADAIKKTAPKRKP